MHAKKLALIAAAILALAVLGAIPTMAAEPIDGDGKGPIGNSLPDKSEAQVPIEVRQREDALLPVAQAIEGMVDPAETGRNSSGFEGYLLVAIDSTSNVVNLYWKGEVPKPIRELIDSDPEVKVVTHDVPYSQDEFMAAQEQVRAASKEAIASLDGAALISIEHTGMRSGLEVSINYDGTEDIQENVETAVIARTTIPVSVKVSNDPSKAAVPLVSRQDDASPWWGGSQIDIAGGLCTSGYPVVMNATGNEYLTTAFHCIYGAGSTGPVSDGDGDDLGVWKNQSSWNRKQYDVTLVKPDSLVVGTRIFRGDAWSTDSIDLAGASTSTIGQTICIDGANSGAHCDVEVIAKNEDRYGVDGTKLAGNVRATSQTSGAAAGVKGDSGGPVYRSSSGTYYGLGTISQGLTEVTCNTATIAHNPTQCFHTVIYTSLTGMLSSFDASLN